MGEAATHLLQEAVAGLRRGAHQPGHRRRRQLAHLQLKLSELKQTKVVRSLLLRMERAPTGPAHGSGPREFDHPLREEGVEGGETGLFSTKRPWWCRRSSCFQLLP